MTYSGQCGRSQGENDRKLEDLHDDLGLFFCSGCVGLLEKGKRNWMAAGEEYIMYSLARKPQGHHIWFEGAEMQSQESQGRLIFRAAGSWGPCQGCLLVHFQVVSQ